MSARAGWFAGLLLAIASGAFIRPAQAQHVSGVVFDSLATGAPLGGATLHIIGTTFRVTTDSAGRFRFDSNPRRPAAHHTRSSRFRLHRREPAHLADRGSP